MPLFLDVAPIGMLPYFAIMLIPVLIGIAIIALVVKFLINIFKSRK